MSKLYTVSCECPTPLASNPWQVLATDETDAVAKFKRRNGISSTDHKITAVEGEGEESDPPEPPDESQLIRAYLLENPDATNKATIEALRESGVVVQSGQVTEVKKAMSDIEKSEGDE